MEISQVFANQAPLVERESSFTSAPYDDLDTYLDEMDRKVLVVGAGGLGCEALKNLAMTGFRNINVVDMDTIDISNLNRQFMFREKDVGRYKSEVVAEYVNSRRKFVTVRSYNNKLQTFTKKWIRNHDIAIACLDNNEARLYLNEVQYDGVRYMDETPEDATIQSIDRHQIVYFTPSEIDPNTMCVLVDGGSEGWCGNAKTSMPGVSSCMKCMTNAAPADTNLHVHMCTIANIPRTPEHCIMFVQDILWHKLETLTSYFQYKLHNRPERQSLQDKETPGDNFTDCADAANVALDKDDENHMTWIWQRAVDRAQFYNIPPPSYTDTMRVVKNIIPAIGSTNALVSAIGINEGIHKLAQSTETPDNRYIMYLSNQYANGTNVQVTSLLANPECTHCKPRTRFVISGQLPLSIFMTAVAQVAGMPVDDVMNKDHQADMSDFIPFNKIQDGKNTELMTGNRFEASKVYEMSNGAHVFKFEVVINE